MSVGIVLVHGYTGSPEDLEPLAQQLSANYNSGSVTNVCLPGHCAENIPHFNKEQFTDCIASAVAHYRKEKQHIIILGHSTGGILALSFLLEHSFAPHLLILAGAPKKIDASCMGRWNNHRSGKESMPFNSVAEMVSPHPLVFFVQIFLCLIGDFSHIDHVSLSDSALDFLVLPDVFDNFIINPTIEEQKKSRLDLILAGTEDAILMIEGYADFLTEEQILYAIEEGHQATGPACLRVFPGQSRRHCRLLSS